MNNATYPRTRAILRWIMIAFYLAAGIIHIVMPAPFLLIMPDWVPWPREVIMVTGLCEIAGAIGLMVPGLLVPGVRAAAGWGLALYAVCVFPANIKHAFSTLPPGAVELGWWYHAPRLAAQPVIVWWALFCSGAITWPVRQHW